jgi:hypothetical protein
VALQQAVVAMLLMMACSLWDRSSQQQLINRAHGNHVLVCYMQVQMQSVAKTGQMPSLLKFLNNHVQSPTRQRTTLRTRGQARLINF